MLYTALLYASLLAPAVAVPLLLFMVRVETWAAGTGPPASGQERRPLESERRRGPVAAPRRATRPGRPATSPFEMGRHGAPS